MSAPLLAADGLSKRFPLRRSVRDAVRRVAPPQVVALDEVSFAVDRNHVLGIVGETGSGKSTLAHCLVRLVEPDAGSIRLDGDDVLAASRHGLRAIRRRLQLIYQDPYSSLNPGLRVEQAISEPARVHGLVSRRGEAALVADMLELVGLHSSIAKRFPRQLSGGQRQRVAIARALALQPEMLIADEAVSALDVSVQAQILNLLAELRETMGLALIFITHQLGVVTHLADSVAVMYLGRIVESGPVERVFGDPHHPYTIGLLQANPRIDAKRRRHTPAVRGELPSASALPSGCRFRTRCPMATDICAVIDPLAVEVAPGHLSRCHVLAPAPEVRPRVTSP